MPFMPTGVLLENSDLDYIINMIGRCDVRNIFYQKKYTFNNGMMSLPSVTSRNKLYAISYLNTITCEQLFYIQRYVEFSGRALYFFSRLPSDMRTFETLVIMGSFNYRNLEEMVSINDVANNRNNYIVNKIEEFLDENRGKIFNSQSFLQVSDFRDDFDQQALELQIQQQQADFLDGNQLLEEINREVDFGSVNGPKDSSTKLKGHSLSSLLSNARAINVDVTAKLPTINSKNKYLIIDSDQQRSCLESSSEFEVIFENKQGSTSSCVDNALICAKKAKQLGYKVSILLLKNGKDLHAVCAIEMDATTSSKVLYEELSAVEIAADEAKADFDYSDYFYNLYSWLLNKFDLDNSYSVFDILKEYFQVGVLESSMSNLYFYPGAPNDPDYSSYGMNNFNAGDSNFKNLQSNNTIGNYSDIY